MATEKPAAEKPSAQAPQTITGIVAARRTVMHDGRQHGPGTVLELSADEHAHLLSTGFLHDPRVPQLTPGNGPQFTGAVDGVIRPK